MDKYQSPFEYPDEPMRLLGIIAAHWEAVELILEQAVAAVMSLNPPRVALLTANINSNNKIDILTAHVRDAFQTKTKNDAIWSEYTAILEKIKAAQTARNNFIHSKWHADKTTGRFTRNKLRTLGGKVQITKEIVSPETLAAIAQEICNVATVLIEFLERQGVDLQLPDKSE